MTQLDEARRLRRNTDPATSHAAANSVAGTLNERQSKVLQLLAQHPEGATYEDLQPAEFTMGGSISSRLTELDRLGLIECIGTRETSRGKQARVWKVAGRKYAASDIARMAEIVALWPALDRAWWRELVATSPKEAIIVMELTLELGARPIQERES